MPHEQQHKLEMSTRKNIALIAHDNRKQELLEWVEFNKEIRFLTL